jgi:hypothetical protein
MMKEADMATHDYDTATVEASAQHRTWIRAWMQAHVGEHRDVRTGEINLTALVENWDHCCADGGVTLDPDHPAWEIAAQVAERAEVR